MDNADREPGPLPGTTPDQKPPPEAGEVRTYGWQWGRDEDRQPELPWIGIFLVVLGGLLLLDRMLPEYVTLGNVVVLAAGLAFLLLWMLRRGTFPLYAGAFLTAASIPGLLEGLAITVGEGFGHAVLRHRVPVHRRRPDVARRRNRLAGAHRRAARGAGCIAARAARRRVARAAGLARRPRHHPADARARGDAASRSAALPLRRPSTRRVDRCRRGPSRSRSSSSSVTTNGGPSRIASPFVPSARPVPE